MRYTEIQPGWYKVSYMRGSLPFAWSQADRRDFQDRVSSMDVTQLREAFRLLGMRAEGMHRTIDPDLLTHAISHGESCRESTPA